MDIKYRITIERIDCINNTHQKDIAHIDEKVILDNWMGSKSTALTYLFGGQLKRFLDYIQKEKDDKKRI